MICREYGTRWGLKKRDNASSIHGQQRFNIKTQKNAEPVSGPGNYLSLTILLTVIERNMFKRELTL